MKPTLLLILCAACSPFSTPSTPPAGTDIQALAAAAVVDTATLDATPDPLGSVAESVSAEPLVLTSTWQLRRGESLAHFARWSELPVEAIAEASHLPLGEALHVGDVVAVPGGAQVRSRVEQARQRHHARRIEGYLAGRGGAQSTAFHTVRTGDTAWSVAVDELGLPVWMLESFNPAVDLDRLLPGQKLLYPVVQDTVASVEPSPADNESPTPATTEAP